MVPDPKTDQGDPQPDIGNPGQGEDGVIAPPDETDRDE
jgi:hypothetical protein